MWGPITHQVVKQINGTLKREVFLIQSCVIPREDTLCLGLVIVGFCHSDYCLHCKLERSHLVGDVFMPNLKNKMFSWRQLLVVHPLSIIEGVVLETFYFALKLLWLT